MLAHQAINQSPSLAPMYVGGEWLVSAGVSEIEVENPATEEPFARISLGSSADVDKAVAAAKSAFPSFSETSVEYRADLLDTYHYVFPVQDRWNTRSDRYR